MDFKKTLEQLELKEPVKIVINKDNDQEHTEGDCWEENGKKYTISNGIKLIVSKFSNVRKEMLLPLSCPKCGNPMQNSKLNHKFWKLRNCCFDCVVKEETQMKIDGTYSEYEENIINKNKKVVLVDIKNFLTDYINTMDSNNYITEDGKIEDWKSNVNVDELKKDLELIEEQICN